MAIRRARIKPVISLPPRRKNSDAGNNTKTLDEETIKKLIKSLHTPIDISTGIKDNEDKPDPRPESSLKPPLPVKNMFIYQVPSSLTVIPKSSEMGRVMVMSDTSNKVIESQRNVGSPLIRHVVPLLIQSSRTEVNDQRWPPFTPEKIPEMPNIKKSEKRPAVAEFFYGKSKIPKKNVTCTIVSSDVPDNNSASSITEGTVIDGIEPLQATSTAPKALVMNGTVSETGEVLFDPVIPLPSVKISRHKLQPILRLSSLVKSSVQGSPSELQDESRRALPVCCGTSTSVPWIPQYSNTSLSTMPVLPNRGVSCVWNNPGSSSVVQAPTLSAVTSSSVKDNQFSKGVSCVWNNPGSSSVVQAPTLSAVTSSSVKDNQFSKGVSCVWNGSSFVRAPTLSAVTSSAVQDNQFSKGVSCVWNNPGSSSVVQAPTLSAVTSSSVKDNQFSKGVSCVWNNPGSSSVVQEPTLSAVTSSPVQDNQFSKGVSCVWNNPGSSSVVQAPTLSAVTSSSVKDNQFSKGVSCVWNGSSFVRAPTLSAVTSSAVQDNQFSKHLEAARKAAAMRRGADAATRDTLTMYDLIYYNPTSNPIVPDKDEIKAKEANEEEARKAAKESQGKAENTSGTKANPAPMRQIILGPNGEIFLDANTSGAKPNPAPVPQVKLGPNGDIILDEKSLVIKQSEKRTTALSTVRRPRSKEWSDAETVRFYRAVAALGADFAVMEQLFPDRNRRQLKYKYTKEQRVNMAQIEKAIREADVWDPKRLLAEFTAEREAEEKAEREKPAEEQAFAFERLQMKTRPRLSKSAKALGSSVLPSHSSCFTANSIIERYMKVKAFKPKATQKPCKRGQPKSKPSPAPATITQDTQVLPNTQPSDDVATTRNIDSPKPQDKMPAEPPNIGVLGGSPGILSRPGESHANIEDGSLVIIPVDDPKSPSNKIYKSYIASKEGMLTPLTMSPEILKNVVTLLGH